MSGSGVTGCQLRLRIRHVEEDLDQDFDPRASQVIDRHDVLLRTHPGIGADQAEDAFAELDQAPGTCRRSTLNVVRNRRKPGLRS